MRFISSDGRDFATEAKADAWETKLNAPKYSVQPIQNIVKTIIIKTPKEIKTSKRKQRSYKNKHPYYKKYYVYKDRITRKNKPFELSFEEFSILIEKDCDYCGDSGGTIDRTDSNEGYTRNNSVPCCYKCNMMKHTLTKQMFLNQVQRIYEHQSN